MDEITEKDIEYLRKLLPGIIGKIKETAYSAGRIILEIYEGDFVVEYKNDNSPLTMADKKANEYIVEVLEKEFPDMAILAEESADNSERLLNDWCWIVDPLDGTKEFVKRNGEFTVNIALSCKGKSVLGVVYVPVWDEMYWGYRGGGAFYRYGCREFYEGCGPHYEDMELTGEKIHVSDRVDNLIMLHSRSHKTSIIDDLVERNSDKIKSIKCAGSSLKGCLIAKGEGDIYYRYGPTMEWDTAAMQCIVEEAGGMLRQMDDSEMTYNRRDSLNSKGFYILNSIENRLKLQ
ncbi:3'(2'), 5'-bisphosphate nucleotidase [Dethiosulfatibacter aminovorans DSM 17477]|uniref:3'(2'),5'-bisphosphate nucleotidase CysQ n=1 Tax=Dethiosulfatibacter aminovorans DSM 17477 TaxID=1121476 RepID=A0A1M6EG75_9FIRM|nr:3'(2'),5'-bisphosphate nucleotidase CysQ [Dethiosulfatibacter aminovorans]SHI84486.1 3'(2'), 5'-bisphosphate nucleotidase [Dethiosulfatibacter aminovorans DSM 17477]